jgi:hypothetical protein
MKDAYYRVILPNGTMSGLTSKVSAEAIAATHNGTVAVSDSAFFDMKGREYRGEYPTVEQVLERATA